MIERNRGRGRTPVDPADYMRTLRKTCSELRELRDIVNAKISRMLERCEDTLQALDPDDQRGNGGAS
jgi:hypothetical protein